ncbi:LysR family transcriptional regulator ArgP [Desulforhopalus sp. IMCC35007]|uniref:LysR family transcriptional regulator ArgP n=1 Tax=Desulforhopalus sp. IMCC35007 TaxID=2569543 RepID=UPI0010AE7529|nr:LysR family transcriptional regulator ArgP [Desulforhopalus sp. IMCC35007]TKB09708.1 LysR family transcriptional regulator ArgP [Desulforhopalus sp. IMCC35007]
MFDYKLVEALAMVSREGSFDKAAKALYITQSAVSQRVKLLEESMGQVLIARTTPPRMTVAGRKLLKHYLQVKRLEDDLTEEIGNPATGGFASLAVGINADSLAIWVLEAIHPFLLEEQVLMEIRVEDQEQTHRLLKDGEVIGCISSQEHPMQGCQIEYLGHMTYRMFAAPGFVAQWFPDGFTVENVCKAPALIFDRKDDLHHKYLHQVLGEVPTTLPAHYLPSVEKYCDFITLGHAYGMLPDQQSTPLLHTNQIVDLSPDSHISVKLYWHCWRLKSRLLEKFTQQLTSRAKTLLRCSG